MNIKASPLSDAFAFCINHLSACLIIQKNGVLSYVSTQLIMLVALLVLLECLSWKLIGLEIMKTKPIGYINKFNMKIPGKYCMRIKIIPLDFDMNGQERGI